MPPVGALSITSPVDSTQVLCTADGAMSQNHNRRLSDLEVQRHDLLNDQVNFNGSMGKLMPPPLLPPMGNFRVELQTL